MSQELRHQELQELLPAAALEILEGAELQQVLAHARSCPQCGPLLEEYRKVTEALLLQLPPATPLDPDRSAVVRARLLAKARGDRRAIRASPRRAATLIHRWSGWMVAAGLAGLLLVHHSVHRPLAYGWLAAGVLLVILFGISVYARVQLSRVSALQDRVADLERRTPEG